jgi:hypothetical protein
MKKISVTLAIAFSVSLIVLSLILPVNYSLARVSHDHAILVADGAGLPPTPPPPRLHTNVILTLDGAGLPPTPPSPKNIQNNTLMLDGAGLPPTPPPPKS